MKVTLISMITLVCISCNLDKPTTLILPPISNFEAYHASKASIDSTQTLANSCNRIVTFLSGDCFECISELKKLVAFKDAVDSEVGYFPIQIYVYSYDFDRFKTFLSSESTTPIDFPLLLDVNGQVYEKFLLENGLQDQKITYLLNSDNEIILTGHPLSNQAIQTKYMNEIKQMKP